MTLDDLCRLYDDAYEDRARLEFPTPEMKRAMHCAGIRAVVQALRDEMWRQQRVVSTVVSNGFVNGGDALDEILGDAGEKVAQGGTET